MDRVGFDPLSSSLSFFDLLQLLPYGFFSNNNLLLVRSIISSIFDNDDSGTMKIERDP
jgi:hypothetical protein